METTAGNSLTPGQAAAAQPNGPYSTTIQPRKPARRGPKAIPEKPPRAFFCLTLKNPIRRLCIKIIDWKYPFYLNFFNFQSGINGTCQYNIQET